MNAEMLEIGLRSGGVMLVGLVLANFVAAKRWSYSANLVACSTIVRQIFHVHCAYIITIIGALALLCLGWPHLLMKGGLSRVVCGFFALFWASRVVVQLMYYDPELRRRDRAWDIFFLGVFGALSLIFTLTTFLQ